jgi:hypothetical protein
MDKFNEVTVTQAAVDWYKKEYYPSVTGKIDTEVPIKSDGDEKWRVVIYPRDGSPEVTVRVDKKGDVDLYFHHATEIKGQKKRITI